MKKNAFIVKSQYIKQAIGIQLTVMLQIKLDEAQSFVSNQEDDVFVYADINCRLKVHFRDHSEKFFDSLDELSGYFFN